MKIPRTLLLAALSSLAALTACGGSSPTSLVQQPPPPPSGAIQLQVLFPPAGQNQQYYTDVQTYLANNPAAPVTGANFAVQWAEVDSGTGSYDFTSVDNKILPWKAAGKKVNLVLWAVSDSPNNTATPQYIWNALTPLNETVTCTGELIPDYFDVTNFQTPYQNFIKAVLQQYGSDSTIGYIRIGLGRGGETFPGQGSNGLDPVCTTTLQNWGYTDQNWINYLTGMLSEAAAGNSFKKQLMVGIVGSGPGGGSQAIPDAVAKAAVPEGIGFGSQGLQYADITDYPNCTADWCNLFNEYTGQVVPLELQTVGPSCPAGVGQCPGDSIQNATGSLVPLLSFTVQHHVTSLEIYYQDWLIAYDPNYPGYGQYGAAYASAIANAAAVK